MWMLDERCATILNKELTTAESPKYADARQPAVAGCLDIDFAITNVYGIYRGKR